MAPADPPQGTAEPSSQDHKASGKTHLRKESEQGEGNVSPSEETLAETRTQTPRTRIPFTKGNTGSRNQWVLVSNKLSGKGGARVGDFCGYRFCLPNQQLCILRPGFPGHLPADRKQWMNFSFLLCFYWWVQWVIRWNIPLVRSGQLSWLCPLTASCPLTAYLMWCGGRRRNRKDLIAVQALFNNN